VQLILPVGPVHSGGLKGQLSVKFTDVNQSGFSIQRKVRDSERENISHEMLVPVISGDQVTVTGAFSSKVKKDYFFVQHLKL